MAVGLRQRDPAGNLLVDITTRLPRIMGRVSIAAGSSGSVTVPVSGSNPLFFYFSVTMPAVGINASPRFTWDQDTISWSYLGANLAASSGVLTYGRY